MKLKHPDSKQTVETDEPSEYLTQGWVEVETKTASKANDK